MIEPTLAFFLIDPLYLVVGGIGLLLSLAASAKVKRAFAKYSQIGTRSGMTGAEVAQRILLDNDIHDVHVEPVRGSLTDHYDPRQKVLRLSEPVYAGRSMAAIGVAAHEVGHAIQHAHAYAPLQFRSMWVPVANIGTNFGFYVLLAGLMTNMFALKIAGVLLFAASTLFTLVTLPVEFDASKRALVALSHGGYATQEEVDGAKKVLDAAALTYVAAFIGSLLTLLYFLFRAGLLGGRSDD